LNYCGFFLFIRNAADPRNFVFPNKSNRMNVEEMRSFCLGLPGVTEDIKWGNNLVFMVGNKMFCLVDLEPPFRVSLKVPEEEFDELTAQSGIIQAPYFARMKWVCVTDMERLGGKEWEHLLEQAYRLVKEKLPKRLQEELEN
jgi:predicted DNA-binding protein (MmcQ/YjbR family)